jgi:hypothetical protein
MPRAPGMTAEHASATHACGSAGLPMDLPIDFRWQTPAGDVMAGSCASFALLST